VEIAFRFFHFRPGRIEYDSHRLARMIRSLPEFFSRLIHCAAHFLAILSVHHSLRSRTVLLQ
jgi:hypothetical protein